MGFVMNEPTIFCPNCKTEIKLTESLAAPLIDATRLQFERKIGEKEAEVAKREAFISEQKAAIEKAIEAIDEQVSQKLKVAREKIIAEEAKKARLFFETDIERNAKEFAHIQEVLKDRDIKLAEAQKTRGRGRFMDNIFIERLWRSIKYEEVHLKAYADGREARAGIGSWMTFYNFRRPHQAMNNQMPMVAWRAGMDKIEAAQRAVDMLLRLDNANALPANPQHKQKQQEAA